MSHISKQLVINGISNLKEFGYPNVTSKNIFTDIIYSAMFKSMLEENLGIRSDVDTAINNLLKQIKPEEKL